MIKQRESQIPDAATRDGKEAKDERDDVQETGDKPKTDTQTAVDSDFIESLDLDQWLHFLKRC